MSENPVASGFLQGFLPALIIIIFFALLPVIIESTFGCGVVGSRSWGFAGFAGVFGVLGEGEKGAKGGGGGVEGHAWSNLQFIIHFVS